MITALALASSQLSSHIPSDFTQSANRRLLLASRRSSALGLQLCGVDGPKGKRHHRVSSYGHLPAQNRYIILVTIDLQNIRAFGSARRCSRPIIRPYHTNVAEPERLPRPSACLSTFDTHHTSTSLACLSFLWWIVWVFSTYGRRGTIRLICCSKIHRSSICFTTRTVSPSAHHAHDIWQFTCLENKGPL